jgi:NAD(P)H-dependent flavin oxidoreductase YrpB (nitropropane dioxygenase family)
MGTRFLLTRESTVPQAVKDVYLKTDVTGTVVTRAIDGCPQRVITHRSSSALEAAGRARRWSALRHAWAFRRADRTSCRALREGLAMKTKDELQPSGSWPWPPTRRCSRAPAWSTGGSTAGILPTGQGVGRHRGAADGGRAHRAHHDARRAPRSGGCPVSEDSSSTRRATRSRSSP